MERVRSVPEKSQTKFAQIHTIGIEIFFREEISVIYRLARRDDAQMRHRRNVTRVFRSNIPRFLADVWFPGIYALRA